MEEREPVRREEVEEVESGVLLWESGCSRQAHNKLQGEWIAGLGILLETCACNDAAIRASKQARRSGFLEEKMSKAGLLLAPPVLMLGLFLLCALPVAGVSAEINAAAAARVAEFKEMLNSTRPQRYDDALTRETEEEAAAAAVFTAIAAAQVDAAEALPLRPQQQPLRPQQQPQRQRQQQQQQHGLSRGLQGWQSANPPPMPPEPPHHPPTPPMQQMPCAVPLLESYMSTDPVHSSHNSSRCIDGDFESFAATESAMHNWISVRIPPYTNVGWVAVWNQPTSPIAQSMLARVQTRGGQPTLTLGSLLPALAAPGLPPPF